MDFGINNEMLKKTDLWNHLLEVYKYVFSAVIVGIHLKKYLRREIKRISKN